MYDEIKVFHSRPCRVGRRDKNGTSPDCSAGQNGERGGKPLVVRLNRGNN